MKSASRIREPLRIFIGYDSKEPIAYHVLAHSILTRATDPVSITPLMLSQLGSIYTRKRGKMESTEFSMTRFLVPYLCDYRGLAIFMDSDMLCRVDIWDIMREVERQPDKAVLVVQHDYTPKHNIKFKGNIQTAYPRKNWSSFMVFNMANYRCRDLTPEYVNTATGLDLHRFNWIDDKHIGSLPLEWNHLVGEYPANPFAKVLHWTLGGPWFPEYRGCDYAGLWRADLGHMTGKELYEEAVTTLVP